MYVILQVQPEIDFNREKERERGKDARANISFNGALFHASGLYQYLITLFFTWLTDTYLGHKARIYFNVVVMDI